MASYFNDESNNAVNNSDGFSTGFIAGNKKSNIPNNQGNINKNVQQPMNNQQMMPNNAPVPPMNNQQPVNKPIVQKQVSKPIQPKVDIKKTLSVSDGNKKNIGKIINFASMGIFMVLIIIMLLIAFGVIDTKKETSVPETPTQEEPTYEETVEDKMVQVVATACQALDENGDYGVSSQKDDERCLLFTCFLENNVLCQNYNCMISDGETVYSKDCVNGNVRKAEVNEFQAHINISEACTVLENNKDLNGTHDFSYANCINYQCDSTVGGKTYTGACTH